VAAGSFEKGAVMVHLSRRALLKGATVLVPVLALGLDGCTPTITFAEAQSYVATADAALDKLAAIIEPTLPASEATSVQNAVALADNAAKAFEALTGPPSGASVAQEAVTLIEDALAVVGPFLPPPDDLYVTAAEVLLATVASFFGISTSTSNADVMALRAKIVAANKAPTPQQAQALLQAWLTAS
jgi:hypothetical protein